MPLISGSLCYFVSIISLSVKKVMDHLRLRTNIIQHNLFPSSALIFIFYSTYAEPSKPGAGGDPPSRFWHISSPYLN